MSRHAPASTRPAYSTTTNAATTTTTTTTTAAAVADAATTANINAAWIWEYIL